MKDEVEMVIGSRLREARKRQNLSQEELGKLLGLSKAAISLYENEKRNPNLETIIEMIYILGVSSDYLLGADVIVEIKDAKAPKYRTFTKEEVAFINELRKDAILYQILFRDYKRGVELVKQKIG